MLPFLTFTAARTKRRQSVVREPGQVRVEFLESRCMLSATPIGITFSEVGTKGTSSAGLIVNGDNSRELELPSFETIPRDSETRPQQEIPPTNEVPPPKEIPPYLPPIGDSGKPEVPSRNNPLPDSSPPVDNDTGEIDPGGEINIGSFDSTKNNSANTSPADVAAQRETRAVLQMLSSLQYSVEERNSGDRLERRQQDTAFQSLFRDLASQLNQPQNDADHNGGEVAIAADEVAAEMQAARAWQPSPELLRDVAVQLESTSGRYQAFEVSTFNETAVPVARDINESLVPRVPTSSFDSSSNGENLPAAADVDALTPEQLPTIGEASLSATPPIDESRKLTWTTAVALITLGILLQVLRDWKLEGLRTQAAVVWHQWIASPLWFRRRSAANREPDRSLPQPITLLPKTP